MKFLRRSYIGFILLFLYAPIAVLVVFSFNASRTMFKWGGFSLKWYAELFNDPMIMEALWVTVTVAVLSAAIATVIGTFAAIGIHNMKKTRKAILTNAAYIPMMNPDIVMGLSLMLLFVFLRIPRGYVTMLLAHITFNIPYVVFSVLPKLRQSSNSMYEAALDLGCTPMKALAKVVLPEIMPGIVTGFIFAFTLSLDDFVVSLFTRQGVSNLSIVIYSMAKKGISPKINALSAIMFVSVIILLVIVNVRSSRNTERNTAT